LVLYLLLPCSRPATYGSEIVWDLMNTFIASFAAVRRIGMTIVSFGS
jgi:hypothetical protein